MSGTNDLNGRVSMLSNNDYQKVDLPAYGVVQNQWESQTAPPNPAFASKQVRFGPTSFNGPGGSGSLLLFSQFNQYSGELNENHNRVGNWSFNFTNTGRTNPSQIGLNFSSVPSANPNRLGVLTRIDPLQTFVIPIPSQANARPESYSQVTLRSFNRTANLTSQSTGIFPGNSSALTFAQQDMSGFGFSCAADAELVVRVLSATPACDKFWVFAAASTDVEYLIRVEDTQTNRPARAYANPLGGAFPPVLDANAFATCR